MKIFFKQLKKLLGAGGYLVGMVLIVECMTVFIRQWIGFPISLTGKIQYVLTLILIGISLSGLAWFNFSLNLIKVNFLDGERKLVTIGPFNYVRHPLYAVILWGLLPLTVVWGADWLFAAAWVLIVVTGHFLVKIEEKGLVADFGEDYQRYRRYVPPLFPYRGNGGKRFRNQV